MKLYYYYDKEADVAYLSQGKPSAKDIVQETNSDVVLRINPKTRAVRGFTILNFSKRTSKDTPALLPITALFTPAA
ncbi:DUF2283 domain-containing protein [Candidatus Kaiserbacteria bacterium]|nr:DUF2283 domain-containing protein [Candidatus Kaiserbacteria bacterium]